MCIPPLTATSTPHLPGKAELRDIYSIGLKTLIADVPEEVGPAVANNLAGRLLGGIQQVRYMDGVCLCGPGLAGVLRQSFLPVTDLSTHCDAKFLPSSHRFIKSQRPALPNTPTRQDGVLEVKLECLDNLTDLLKRFGR